VSAAEQSDREHRLRTLMSALHDPQQRELLLVGAPASTHELIELAIAQPRFASRYPDGVLWLDGERPHPWLTDARVAQRCTTPHRCSVAEGALTWLCSARALVVVNDGVAHPTLAAQLRSVIGATESRVLWLEAEAPAGAEVTLTLASARGAQLLADFERLSGGGVTSEETQRLLHRTAGDPLSLRLIAGLLRHPATAPFQEQLQRDTSLTPSALVTLAWEACTPAEQRALARASQLPGSFGDDAVVAATGLDGAHWRELAGRGWCGYDREQRWRFPRLVRQLLQALHPSPIVDHAEWGEYVEQQLKHGQVVGFDNIDTGAHEIALVWEQSLRDGDAQRWIHCADLLKHWARGTNNFRLLHDWTELLLERLEGAQSEPPSREHRHTWAQLRFAMAATLNDLQHLKEANEVARAGLALVADEPALRSEGLRMQASSYFHRNRFQESLALLRESLEAAQLSGANPVLVANLLADLAQSRLMIGELDGAESAFRQAIILKQQARQTGLALPNINALGLLLIALERFDEARAVLQDGVQQGRRLRNRTILPYLLHSLALVHLEVGEFERAYHLTTEAFQALETSVHAQIAPLLQSTLLRTMAQSVGVNMALYDLQELLGHARQHGDGVAWYASLAVIDYLAGVAQRPADALALARLVAAAPHEGHLNSIIRRTLARLAPDTPPAAAAPTLSELWEALATHAPELLGPPTSAAG